MRSKNGRQQTPVRRIYHKISYAEESAEHPGENCYLVNVEYTAFDKVEVWATDEDEACDKACEYMEDELWDVVSIEPMQVELKWECPKDGDGNSLKRVEGQADLFE